MRKNAGYDRYESVKSVPEENELSFLMHPHFFIASLQSQTEHLAACAEVGIGQGRAGSEQPID